MIWKKYLQITGNLKKFNGNNHVKAVNFWKISSNKTYTERIIMILVWNDVWISKMIQNQKKRRKIASRLFSFENDFQK